MAVTARKVRGKPSDEQTKKEMKEQELRDMTCNWPPGGSRECGRWAGIQGDRSARDANDENKM
jgi:hypothetical protein